MEIYNELLALLNKKYKGHAISLVKMNFPLAFANIAYVYETMNEIYICQKNEKITIDDIVSVYCLTIKAFSSKKVFLYLSNYYSPYKKRIVDAGISFVDSKGNLHFECDTLKALNVAQGISFISNDTYTKSVQLVAKYYFKHAGELLSTRNVGSKLNISPAMVSKANDFLFTNQIIEKIGLNTLSEYVLRDKKSSFKKIRSHLIDPCKEIFYSMISISEKDFLLDKYPISGDLAISQYTNLAPQFENKIQIAIRYDQFKSFKEELDSIRDSGEKRILLEVQLFIYEPMILSDSNCIDLFDTYLLFLFNRVNDFDERVNSAESEIKRKLGI